MASVNMVLLKASVRKEGANCKAEKSNFSEGGTLKGAGAKEKKFPKVKTAL